MTKELKVIAFDLFGTVLDFAGVDRDEVRAYAQQLRDSRANGWRPLQLPKHWERLKAFPDAADGLKLLRTKYRVVTCSNAPLELQTVLVANNGLPFDALIPLEANQVYKPDFRAYMTVCQIMSVEPENVLMVTANKDFGDLEGAEAAGMKSVLIRDDNIPTITALAELLECSN